MYLVSKKKLTTKINLIILDFKKKKKDIIFLRSPKHYNIGKRKIFFSNINKMISINLNFPYTDGFAHSINSFFINILNLYLKFKLKNSKIIYKTKIKFINV